ncbi:MAG: hypothetical protein LBK28_02175 [Propionibacteriaceae bacterium]|jgi:hypothetical protein|nr:hypothetical protein [Propionibacteriaceae bacterium]
MPVGTRTRRSGDPVSRRIAKGIANVLACLAIIGNTLALTAPPASADEPATAAAEPAAEPPAKEKETAKPEQTKDDDDSPAPSTKDSDSKDDAKPTPTEADPATEPAEAKPEHTAGSATNPDPPQPDAEEPSDQEPTQPSPTADPPPDIAPALEPETVSATAPDSPDCAAGQLSVTHSAAGQTAVACLPRTVSTGGSISITGHGWLTTDGQAGATVVLKLNSRTSPSASDFQFVHTGQAGDAIVTHPTNGTPDPTIWALVQADASGSFSVTVPMPGPGNSPSHIGPDGALEAGRKLVVHFQSGLLAADTQHTVDSDPLSVNGTAYPGDQTGGGTACVATGPVEASISYPDGQVPNPITGPVFSHGQTIQVRGSGWCAKDPLDGGSIIAVKIDDGAYSHPPNELIHSNPQVWALIEVDSADGSFVGEVTLPTAGSGPGAATPAFTQGVHSLRLLTGSIKADDVIRTVGVGPFTVGDYRPNGVPSPLEAEEQLTADSRGGLVVTRSDSAITAELPGAQADDWVFLTVYTEDGSVRYPWAATWFQADATGVVSAALADVTLPVGKLKLTAQAPDSSLLGWAELLVESTTDGDDSAKIYTRPTLSLMPRSAQQPTLLNLPPATIPAAPVADLDELTEANAGGLRGSTQGTVLTLTLPSRIKAGDWVFLYVYPGRIAVGWVQTDSKLKVRLDLSLLGAGDYKIVALDTAGALIGWTGALIGGGQAALPAEEPAAAALVPPAVRTEPTAVADNATASTNDITLWLGLATAVAVACCGSALAVRRKRLSKTASGN